MFRKMSIRAKLMASFLLLTVVFAATGILAVWQLQKIDRGLQTFNENAERSNRILYLNSFMETYRADVARYLLEGTVDLYT